MAGNLDGDAQRPVVSGQRVQSVKLERARQLRRAMTTAERIMWQLLRARRLAGFHFRRQQVIAGYIVDFYCHATWLVVELDGAVHQRTVAYDAARDEQLEAQEVLVLRFTNAQVMASREAVLDQIATVCAERRLLAP